MAKFTFKSKLDKTSNKTKVTITFTNNVPNVIETFKRIFDVELVTADITRGESETTLVFETANREKMAFVEDCIIQTFNEACGIGKPSMN